MSSLHGYCGAMVSWQLYLLGITTKVIGNNGNTQYDYYSKQECTSGGYRVHTYPASDYTLEAALKEVSHDGTRDVYNIVVCFDRTNTAAGRKYGHALLVHAIIDGVVYFSESFSGTFNGKYYPEGSPIVIPITDFAKYYTPWTTFEGVLYFELDRYINSCTAYPSYLYATTIDDVLVYSEPCDTLTDSRSTLSQELPAGYTITATGLYLNTKGEYWYRVNDVCTTGYVLAEKLSVKAMCYDDIKIDSFICTLPSNVINNFNLTGTVSAEYNKIISIRVQLFSISAANKKHVTCATDTVKYNTYKIYEGNLTPTIQFASGVYRLELAVIVGNYYYADSQLQTEWKTIKLFTANFKVLDVIQLKNNLKQDRIDRIYQMVLFDIYDQFIFNKFIFAKLYDCSKTK